MLYEIHIKTHFNSLAEAIEWADTALDGEVSHTVVKEIGDELLGDADGIFCEGCDGHVFGGVRWPTATNGDMSHSWVERCDQCERFESDDAALAWLLEVYADAGDPRLVSGLALVPGLTAPSPFLDIN